MCQLAARSSPVAPSELPLSPAGKGAMLATAASEGLLGFGASTLATGITDAIASAIATGALPTYPVYLSLACIRFLKRDL